MEAAKTAGLVFIRRAASKAPAPILFREDGRGPGATRSRAAINTTVSHAREKVIIQATPSTTVTSSCNAVVPATQGLLPLSAVHDAREISRYYGLTNGRTPITCMAVSEGPRSTHGVGVVVYGGALGTCKMGSAEEAVLLVFSRGTAERV